MTNLPNPFLSASDELSSRLSSDGAQAPPLPTPSPVSRGGGAGIPYAPRIRIQENSPVGFVLNEEDFMACLTWWRP